LPAQNPFDLHLFEIAYMSTASPTVTETKIVLSDPTALGVFGLSIITFVAASQKLGGTTGSTYLVPWALFLGSIVLGVHGLF
jgi:uncharacterized protein